VIMASNVTSMELEHKEHPGRKSTLDDLKEKSMVHAERFMQSKLGQLIFWILRLSDYSSDALLLIAILYLIASLPAFTLEFPKTEATTFNVTAGLGSSTVCYTEYYMNIRDACDNHQYDDDKTMFLFNYSSYLSGLIYTADYSADEEGWNCSYADYSGYFEDPSFLRCPDGYSCLNSQDYGSTFVCSNDLEENTESSAYDYVELVYATGQDCSPSYFTDNYNEKLSITLFVDCNAAHSAISPTSANVDGRIWNCWRTSVSSYKCQLSDDLLINTLMILFFVFIGKEILVMVNYRFVCFEIIDEDLNHLSADSLLLLGIFMLRILGKKREWFKYAYAVITDEKYFFTSWMLFDFMEKLASAAITAIILFVGWNGIAFFAFLTTFIGFLSGIQFWRERCLDYIRNVHFEQLEREDPYQAERYTPVKQIGFGTKDINEQSLPDPDPGLLWRMRISKLKRHIIPFIRVSLITIIVFTWVWLLYTDYVDSFLDIKIKTKLVGVLLVCSVFAEYSLLSHYVVDERRQMRADLAEAYMSPLGREYLSQESLAYYTLVSNIDASLSWTEWFQWIIFQRRHFGCDVFISPIEIIAVVLLWKIVDSVNSWYTYFYYCAGEYTKLSGYAEYGEPAGYTVAQFYRIYYLGIDCDNYSSSDVLDSPDQETFSKLKRVFYAHIAISVCYLSFGLLSLMFTNRFVRNRFRRGLGFKTNLDDDIGGKIKGQLKL